MARPKYPSDDIEKSMVRFPPGLMDQIKSAAASNHRSMNAEIISRLENSFAREDGFVRLSYRELEQVIHRAVKDLGGPDFEKNVEAPKDVGSPK